MNSIQNTNWKENDFEVRLVLTKKCNFDCSYCYEEKKTVDFSRFNDLGTMLKRNMGSSNFILTFSGGEPLLKTDLILECLRCMEKIPNDVDILTNGFFLFDDPLNKLVLLNKSILRNRLNIRVSVHLKSKDLFKVIRNMIEAKKQGLAIEANIMIDMDKDWKETLEFIQKNGSKTLKDGLFSLCTAKLFDNISDQKEEELRSMIFSNATSELRPLYVIGLLVKNGIRFSLLPVYESFVEAISMVDIGKVIVDGKEVSWKSLYDISKFDFRNWNCRSGQDLVIVSVDGICYQCSVYYRKNREGKDLTEYERHTTSCKEPECFCFTSRKDKIGL